VPETWTSASAICSSSGAFGSIYLRHLVAFQFAIFLLQELRLNRFVLFVDLAVHSRLIAQPQFELNFYSKSNPS
jgi:hypothetical protein